MHIFAGNWLEYQQFVTQREENGYFEISKIEHLEKIPVGGTLYVIGNYKKRKLWPQIKEEAAKKLIEIKEL